MNTLGLRQEDAVDREGYAPFYISIKYGYSITFTVCVTNQY